MTKKHRYFDLESLTESKNVDWSSCIISVNSKRFFSTIIQQKYSILD